MNEIYIINFGFRFNLYKKIVYKNDFYINEYQSSKNINIGYYILIYYNNLNIKFDYIFNLSNMLYKLHNPNYYRKYNHKELI